MEANSFTAVGNAMLEARGRVLAAGGLPANDERRMAQLGTAALFEEALLGALRAHLGELKTVAR